MKAKIENKEKVLFWLKRREKVLEAGRIDHEAFAREGVPYATRAKIEGDAAKAGAANHAELESIQAAILFIEENAE